MADIQELTSEVDSLEEVVPSAIALLDGTLTRIEAAVAKAVAANDQADMSAITNEIAQIRAQKQALADAVARNTVADDETGGGGEVSP